jgi:ABC-type transporter Mla maintaining outer membrane lipid asymmetry permease subunit MlaE
MLTTIASIFLIIIAVSAAFMAGFFYQSRKTHKMLADVFRGEVGTIYEMAAVFLSTMKQMEQAYTAASTATETGNETTPEPVVGEVTE